VAIGNGANDRLMVARAELGIAVIGPEGAAATTVAAAAVVCPTIASALGLLINPMRLVATLRN
jgi:soluble P-type ATPase